MKVSSMREMTREELEQHKRDLEDELFNLNMRRSLKSLDNPLRLRTIKREIGRVNTILHEDATGMRSLAQSRTSVLGESETEKK